MIKISPQQKNREFNTNVSLSVYCITSNTSKTPFSYSKGNGFPRALSNCTCTLWISAWSIPCKSREPSFVCTSISSSIVFSKLCVEMLPWAPGRKLQPPHPPIELSKCLIPFRTPWRTFACARPFVLCMCIPILSLPMDGFKTSGLRSTSTWSGLAFPCVSANTILSTSSSL